MLLLSQDEAPDHSKFNYICPSNLDHSGVWSLSQLSLGEQLGTLWTGRQTMTVLTQRTHNRTLSAHASFCGRKLENLERTHTGTERTCSMQGHSQHHYVNCNIPTHWRYTENERKWSHNWQFISPNHFTLKRRKQHNSSNFKLRSEARGFRLHTAEHRACIRLHWFNQDHTKKLWVMSNDLLNLNLC